MMFTKGKNHATWNYLKTYFKPKSCFWQKMSYTLKVMRKMLLSRVPALFSHVTKVIGSKAIICALIHSCQDYTTITLKLFKKTLLKA